MTEEGDAKRFQLLVAAAAVDGRVGESERAVLKTLGEDLGLTAAEVHASIEGAGSDRSLALSKPEDRSARLKILEQLAAVVRADGHVAGQEQLLFGRIARALGIAEEEWRPLLGLSPPPPVPKGILLAAHADPPGGEAPGTPAPTPGPPGVKARVLAGLPPTSILLAVVGGLLLIAGTLSFAAPEFLPSQRRILALLGAVLLAGGAIREPGRVRHGLWALMGLTCLTWMARHPLGAGWFGGLCVTLGAAALVFARAHGGWRPGRAEARAGLQVTRGVLGLVLLVVLAGGVAAGFEFFDLLEYGSKVDLGSSSSRSATPGAGWASVVEFVVGGVTLVLWLLVELLLAGVALGSVVVAAALVCGFGGVSVAIHHLKEPDAKQPHKAVDA